MSVSSESGLEDSVTWLLVEDDNDIRNVVAVMMSVWGEKPLSFADGNAAWTWLDSVVGGTFTGELPDLALMDIRMPGYTGDKVAARIRQTPGIKDIPVILMTAFSLSDAEVQSMMEEAGIDHLINKPLPDMEIFRSTLYRVRDERRARLASRAEAAKAANEPAAQPAQPGTQPVTPQVGAPQTGAAPAPAPSQTAQPSQATQQAAKPADQQPPAKPSEPAKPGQPGTQPATPQAGTPQSPPAAPAQSTQQAAKPADQQSPTKPSEPASRPSQKASEKESK
jgi:CheY-like chemotaxis protein